MLRGQLLFSLHFLGVLAAIHETCILNKMSVYFPISSRQSVRVQLLIKGIEDFLFMCNAMVSQPVVYRFLSKRQATWPSLARH